MSRNGPPLSRASSRTRRGLSSAESLDGPLQQRHVLGVAPRDVPDDPAAIAHRGLGKHWQLEALGHVRGLQERCARGGVTRPGPGIAEGHEQLAARRVVAGEREGRLVEADGLLVGQL